MSPIGALPADGRGSCPAVPLRVAVQDPRRLVREGLAALLAAEPDLEVVAAVAHARTVDRRADVIVGPAGADVPATGSARLVPFDDGGSFVDLVRAIRSPAPHIPTPRAPVHRGTEAPRLTPREVQVMAGIAGGLSSTQVAADLGISRKSVDNHKQRIFGKLGVQSQAHAVAVTAAHGLLGAGRAGC